ncbi:MAG TPA: DUF3108 domain-containing protein [Gemmatimonadaceae bacterium]
MIQPAVGRVVLALFLSAIAPAVAVPVLQGAAPPASVGAQAPRLAQRVMHVPFGTGERFVYDVRFGSLKVGTGTMEVRGVERVRGRDTWHTSFLLKAGTFFYKVNDVFESWIDTETFYSLRFLKQLEEGTEERAQSYEIYPEKRLYVNERNDKPPRTLPTVAQPLDDGSFLYFVRTLPLVVGQTYEISRYFIPDRNPVTIRVLRRERVTVPAGTFNAIVVQPLIKTSGIFSENGRAEVWLSDDSSRMVLQIKSKLPFGSLNLYLTSYALAAVPAKTNPGN